MLLEPGLGRDAVYCEFVEVELDSPEPEIRYEALSYRWQDVRGGGSDLRCTPHIHIRGPDLWALPVSDTVIEAMYAFRQADRPRYLWVDQICINQKSVGSATAGGQRLLSEKDSQVRAMGEVYKRAAGVLVWFGVEQPCDAPAMAAIRKFGLLFDEARQKMDEALAGTCSSAGFTRLFQSTVSHLGVSAARVIMLSSLGSILPALAEEYGFTQVSALPSPGDIPWSHCLEFLQKPWFSRAWPVQEVVLSGPKTAHCGARLSVNWEYIGFFASIIRIHSGYRAAGRVLLYREHLDTATETFFYALAYSGRGLPLLQLLLFMRSFDSGDPRDKVYALLNMVDFQLGASGTRVDTTDESLLTRPETLDPDYSEQTTPDKVNCETAVYLIRRDRNLDILSYSQCFAGAEATASTTAHGTISSWAPSWTRGPERTSPIWSPSLARDEREDDRFHACGRFSTLGEADITYTERANEGVVRRCLALQGIRASGGIVETVSGPAPQLQLRLDSGKEALDLDYAAVFRWVSEVVEWDGRARNGHLDEDLLSSLSLTLTGGCHSMGVKVLKERRNGTSDTRKTVSEHVEDFVAFLLDPARQDVPVSEGMGKLMAWLRLRPGSIPTYKATGTDWARSVRKACRGKRVIRNQRGVIGLAPGSTEVGDQVYIFKGGRTPFAVRDANLGDSRSRILLGQCYLWGVMEGELEEDMVSAEWVELV